MKNFIIWLLVTFTVSLVFYFVFFYHRIEVERFDDGKIRKEYPVNFFSQIDGELLEYWEGGKVKRRANFVDGIQEGFMIEYYESGKIFSRTNVRNGKLVDSTFFYAESGEIDQIQVNASGEAIEYDNSEREIKKGTIGVDGKFTGITKSYKGSSKEWAQMKHFNEDSLDYLITNEEKAVILTHIALQFTISFPQGVFIDVEQKYSGDFYATVTLGKMLLDMMVSKDQNLFSNIDAEISEGVDSTLNNVVRSHTTEEELLSKLVFDHDSKDNRVSLIVLYDSSTYLIKVKNPTDDYREKLDLIKQIIGSFGFAEFSVEKELNDKENKDRSV
ncbi:MAG: toxin-antitoxin system YwqK family antitoxin [Imperialibacter sp.]|uniref:toxin-antitoxin system YwqK family antitoxin n=1 Tax=unclassified Imperialibacter TaxID=2629706 RepID=UPI00125EBAB7|nr:MULTISPECIES: hypothetical protein [unclassified Imperialibacter]